MTLVVMSHRRVFPGHRRGRWRGRLRGRLNHTGGNALDRSRQGYLSISRRVRIRRLRGRRLAGQAAALWRGRLLWFLAWRLYRPGAGAAPFQSGVVVLRIAAGLPCVATSRQQAPVSRGCRVKALVIADPLNAFAPSALAGVAASVQLWASEQGGDGVTAAWKRCARAPAGTDFRRVAGAGHLRSWRRARRRRPTRCRRCAPMARVSTGRLFIAISTPASSLSCARPCAGSGRSR